MNVPTAAISLVGIARGTPADKVDELHDEPIDIPGALLGTTTIMCALVAPTFFVDLGMHSVLPWATLSGAGLLAVLFALREHATDHPLLDVKLVAQPLVSSGLAFKAAAGLATASLGYLVTLQLQLAWAWSPARMCCVACRRTGPPRVLRWSIRQVSWQPESASPSAARSSRHCSP